MKLEYINCASVKKAAKRHKRRTSTSFFTQLNGHVTDVVLRALADAGDDITLKAEHITKAIKTQSIINN